MYSFSLCLVILGLLLNLPEGWVLLVVLHLLQHSDFDRFLFILGRLNLHRSYHHAQILTVLIFLHKHATSDCYALEAVFEE